MHARFLHSARVLSAAMRPVISVSIWSDIACPWCYVGKRRLDLAEAEFSDRAEFKNQWHAYLLDENFQAEGMPHDEYYLQKFGKRGPELKQHIKEAGRQDGVQFAGWDWRGNTMAGHRLIALARQHGKDHKASGLLFEKAYEQGANLSQLEHVIAVGEALGLPGAAEWVRDPEAGAAEVREDDDFAKNKLEVTGVPFFLIGLEDSEKRYSFSGAQPVANFKEVFERVLKEAEAAGAGPAGGQHAEQ